MLLKYFYDDALAHASYMVGCQKSGEAMIVDPGRDVQHYLDAAAQENMTIVGVADTHIHADYVSGARQLADQHGAKLYLSDEGPTDWQYQFFSEYDHMLLRDGDRFTVGRIEFTVLHTPGHTPESLSFMLTDRGGGATEPMGIFTGDFVFVGSIGRPDLLEQAAGQAGTAEPGARDLFGSIERFKALPDYLQVWPAHGAGSACGKGLGSIPSSTVGYEQRFNPALQYSDEQEFVDYILSEQPEAPKYFAVMKRVNKEGPPVLSDDRLPVGDPTELINSAGSEQPFIDTRPSSAFASAFVPGTINIPMKYLASWAGWLVDYQTPLHIIASKGDADEANRILKKIGVEQVVGYYDADEVAGFGLNTQSYEEVSPMDIAARFGNKEVVIVDVRGETEWEEMHIPESRRCFLADLPEMLKQFAGQCTLAFQCRSGGRSAIATSLAKVAGVERAMNLAGGIQAWKSAGLPVNLDPKRCGGPDCNASTGEAAQQGQAIFWNAECPLQQTM